MNLEEELGSALRNSWMEVAAASASDPWSGLPPELLEMIGSKITEGAHLHNAAMVCKSWNTSIATGLTSMEVDMHNDPAMWCAKMDKLQRLLRHLRCVIIHVNAAISDNMIFHNIALVQQLKGVSELKLHLREGCELPPAAAAAIGSMPQLTSISIIGGSLKPESTTSLLSALAANATAAADSGGGLQSLTLLPAVPHGLGDSDMALLSACSTLEVLEFRAYRLTSSGLATLSMGLPALTRLAITSMDSDSGYELACLERLARLAELDLALDGAPTGAASRRALCAVRPGRSLSLSFRWTDKAQNLLTEYGNRLANLTHLDVGACRVGSESLFEAVAQLTGLRELRMAVYSNADHCIPCHLSHLSALAALQRFQIEKRRAYFPEARRFGESSIAVPVTAEGLRALAGRWSRLRALRLALSHKDYSPEALSVLCSFTGLKELGIVVERYPGYSSSFPLPQQYEGTEVSTTPRTASELEQQQQPLNAALGSGGGSGMGLTRMSRRAIELPPLLDLACLPAGINSLELNTLVLELSGAVPQPQVAVTTCATSRSVAEVVVPELVSLELIAPKPPNVVAAATAAAATSVLPPSGSSTPPPPLPLSQLTSLEVEACVVRPPLLASVARLCGQTLRSLRLVGVVGLSDAVLAECLPALPMLQSLTVSALSNRAVTQASLAALSSPIARPPGPSCASQCDPGISAATTAAPGPTVAAPWQLRPPLPPPKPPARVLLPLLRHLTWESDDLTARGPDLQALAPLTSLRHLSLSCTDKTAEIALGSLKVLQDTLPYCHVDMVWTAARPSDEP